MQSRSVLLQWIGGFWWVFLPCPLVGFFHLLNLGLFHSCGSCGFWWFLGFFPWWVFGFFHSFPLVGFTGFSGNVKKWRMGKLFKLCPAEKTGKENPKTHQENQQTCPKKAHRPNRACLRHWPGFARPVPKAQLSWRVQFWWILVVFFALKPTGAIIVTGWTSSVNQRVGLSWEKAALFGGR